jgi:hypothetical protein
VSAFHVQPLGRLFLLAALLAGLACANQARAATCTSVVNGGAWNAPATWGVGGCPGAIGGVPDGDDAAIIATNVTISSNVTVNQLTINAGQTLTVGNNRDLIVNTTTTIDGTLSLASGGTKRFSGFVTVNAGGVWNNVGNVAVNFRGTGGGGPNGGGGIAHNGTTFDNGTGTVTFNNDGGNAFTVSGASNIIFRGAVTLANNIVITRTNTGTVTIVGQLNGSNAGSTWNNDGGRLDYGGGATNPTPVPMATGVFNADNATNTVNYARAGTQTVDSGTAYRNLVLGGPLLGVAATSAKTANGALTVNGNLMLGGDTTALPAEPAGTATFTASTFTHTLNGSFIINTSAATPLTVSTTSEFIFNAPFSAPGGTTMGGATTATIAFADVTIRNPGAVMFNDNASFSSGTTPTLIVVGGATLTPAAAVIISGTGTLTGHATEGAGTVQVTRTAATPDFASQYTIATRTLVDAGSTGNHLTVDYSASAAQTVNNPAGGYGHLKLSGSGVKTMPGTALAVAGSFTTAGTAQATAASAMTVGGNFDVGAGTTFSATTFTHLVAGNFTRSGTFNDDTSTFNFNGTAAQAITGTVTFNNLTVSNTAAAVTPGANVTVNANVDNGGTLGGSLILAGGSAAHQLSGTGAYNNLQVDDVQGALLLANPTVNGALTLTSGLVMTGGVNTLIIGSAGTTSGASASSHVVGNLAKQFSAPGSFTYAVGDGTRYVPVDVTFTALPTSGRMTVSATAGDHPDTTAESSSLDPAKSVNRYWTIKNTTAVGTFDATFNYLSTDLDGGVTAASLLIARGASCTGSGPGRSCSNTWSRPTLSGTPTTTQATATGLATGVTESDFVVGQAAPTRFSREKEFVFTRELY